MKTYELQIYREGSWKIDSFYDDRELVLFEAHRMNESHRYSGIRVVEEIHDSDTGKTRTRTVFQRTAAQKAARRDQAMAEPRNVRHEPPAATVAKENSWRPIHLMLAFSGLLLLGFAAVILLRFLAGSA